MMNILVVDDDPTKVERIREIIDRALEVEETDIDVASTVCQASGLLSKNSYSLMVLDLNLPMRAGEDPKPDNGQMFLEQIAEQSGFNIPGHVLGLTAYKEYIEEYSGLFAELTWGLCFYDISSDEWEKQLRRKCQHIAASNLIERNTSYETDMLIVVALDMELDQVLRLPGNWGRTPQDGDDTLYYRGEFKRGNKKLSVTACAAIHKGMPAATGLAVKACSQFKPKYLAMTGIAAGVSGNFGDVLIADQCWDYGSGKIRRVASASGDGEPEMVFAPEPRYLPVNPGVLELVRRFCHDTHILSVIKLNSELDTPEHDLSYQIGAIASGAAVIEDGSIMNGIKTHDRKLIGVEMEAYGILVAAHVCAAPRPKAMVFKSIADRGDENKSDEWQQYAAYTSAAFLYEFSLAHL